MKVLVVYGGEGLSSEAAISISSAPRLLNALTRLGHAVTVYNLTKSNLSDLPEAISGHDFVWPGLHGEFGEDGGIQKMCETAGMNYLGSNSIVSKLCFDKWAYKQKLDQAGILNPKGRLITAQDLSMDLFPGVIKPAASGSAVDLCMAREKSEEKLGLVRLLVGKYHEMLWEELIEGMEISVGVLGEEVLPAIEIMPPVGQEYDYDNKYNGQSIEITPPASLSPEQHKRAQELAMRVHQLCGCRHLSRTDMILREDKFYVLETNTLPGMTGFSLFPQEALAAGYDFDELIKELLDLAVSSNE